MSVCIVDLHCDSLTKAYDNGWGVSDERLSFSPGRIPAGMNWVQFMAVFIPDELRGTDAREYFDRVNEFYNEYISEEQRIPVNTDSIWHIENAVSVNPFTAVLSVEGGAVLEGDPANVESLYAAGVRMLTLTWNGANELCGGWKSGGGFTAAGRETVHRMEAAGMAVDVSHISDEGFFELCGFARKPFVASHSNARKICGHPRNLTDDMFREIVRRGGLVGINYYDHFIREGGGSSDAGDLLRHIHHFLELGGEDVLALGSDFDGADTPPYISGADKIGSLIDAMGRSGISKAVISKILSHNAVRFFNTMQGEWQ
ncbi:MAG: dipeptidase [Oscillospiraceae bacterium]|nr:dipeptidase [Oscillospiraceae bacterium]